MGGGARGRRLGRVRIDGTRINMYVCTLFVRVYNTSAYGKISRWRRRHVLYICMFMCMVVCSY